MSYDYNIKDAYIMIFYYDENISLILKDYNAFAVKGFYYYTVVKLIEKFANKKA